ncbi:hypothetical protein N657DRAFT_674530 [Parathielavia appendiculata]|uniref:Uncharacterized protein n=1 Tax=Parathielavia appendiculata TaxID=2587402 RepID=A0AAN6TSS9_9PEZI|nr:hypothetical protein N657DRAFT_674530 [Parathielavia appendiculata]
MGTVTSSDRFNDNQAFLRLSFESGPTQLYPPRPNADFDLHPRQRLFRPETSTMPRQPNLYRRLSERRDEIRLLGLLPESRATGIPHCTHSTHSVRDLTAEYLALLSGAAQSSQTATTTNGSSSSSSLSKRSSTSRWINSRLPPHLASLEPISRRHLTSPPRYQHRFTWGDYAGSRSGCGSTPYASAKTTSTSVRAS